MERGIPVWILNTNHPNPPGTVINRQGDPDPRPVTSIAYKKNQVMLTISSNGMPQQGSFLAKVFEVLARQGVVVGRNLARRRN